MIVCGIDAGGTGVRVRFADADTLEPTGGEASVPANTDGLPPGTLPPPAFPVASVCAGITKITRAGVKDAWERYLRDSFPGAVITVVPDYEIAFHATVPDGCGVLVVAGTGSVAYGERNGATLRVGGRGYEWGDEGSGAWLTTEMMRRSLRALDGQGDETALSQAVCAELETTDPAELAARARARAETDGRGFLLPLLSERAAVGDGEARELFAGAGGWLARLSATCAHRLGFAPEESVTTARTGGVWHGGGEPLASAFEGALRRRFPSAICGAGGDAPVIGALREAARNFARNRKHSPAGIV